MVILNPVRNLLLYMVLGYVRETIHMHIKDFQGKSTRLLLLQALLIPAMKCTCYIINMPNYRAV